MYDSDQSRSYGGEVGVKFILLALHVRVASAIMSY
jgi:hypothetical protein